MNKSLTISGIMLVTPKNRYLFSDYTILDIYFIMYILSTRHSISKTEISREFDIMRPSVPRISFHKHFIGLVFKISKWSRK